MNREPVALNITPIKGIILQSFTLQNSKTQLSLSDAVFQCESESIHPTKQVFLPRGTYRVMQLLSDAVMEPYPHYQKLQYVVARKAEEQNQISDQFFFPIQANLTFDNSTTNDVTAVHDEELQIPVIATTLGPLEGYDVCIYFQTKNEKLISKVLFRLYEMSVQTP